MKVLLINPPTGNLIKTFAPDELTEEMGLYPPMGLLYIAAYAKKAQGRRFDIEVLDTQVERMKSRDIEQALKERKPDVVGVSAMTFLVKDALEVCRLAKKVNPDTHTIVGGAHPTIYPREMLSQPETDSVVYGEGEITFSEFLDALEAGQSLAGIKGLGYKEKNEIILNPKRDFIVGLDSLPFPDRSLVPHEKYYNLLGGSKEIMTGLLTTRGCPYHCIFCTKKDGRLCRMRSPENVVTEIEECAAGGITDFDIIDDTFTVNRKRLLAIAGLIIKKNLNITMDLRARVNHVDEEMIERLAQAGCNRIRFGVESGNPKVLENLKKGITLEEVRRAFHLANRAGITTFAYFMLGSPGETEKEIKDSVKLAKEINPDYAQFLVTTPFPATELYRLGMEKGILKGDYWREFSRNPQKDFTPQWWTENFTHQELEHLQKKAHLSFYYRPRYVWKQLKKVKSLKEFLRKAKAAFRLSAG